MAKRFIDTGIFNDSWFMGLSVSNKLFFIYLITNCDHAGIIDLNIKLAEFQTGIKGLANSLLTVIKEFDNRLIRLSDNYYFIPKFIKYQYPNGLSNNVKAQLSVINKLKEFNLFDDSNQTVKQELANSLLTVQDIDIDKDKDKDKDKQTVKIETKNDLHPLQKYVIDNFPNVSKLKTQLTKQNCIELLKNYSKETVKNVLMSMENKKDLNKKYTSVYLTCNNWCENDNSKDIIQQEPKEHYFN